MVRATLCTLALVAMTASPIACDTGGDTGTDDPGEDTMAPEDTTSDTTPRPTDTLEDTQPPPEDILADAPPPPEDSVEDMAPPPDILGDIPWGDIPWQDIPWQDIPWEDIPCDIPDDIPDLSSDVPCDPPIYSSDCAEVPYFQCGFMGWCAEGVLHAEWHEHVFCDGQEAIIDYTCSHACAGGCKDGDIMDWPEDGPAFVEGYCKAKPDCDIPPLYTPHVLEDILANPDPLDGAAVAFEGPVTVGAPICTLAECTEEDPCCNGCGANYEVTADGGTIEIVGGAIPQVGCYGDNCTFMDNCTPFPVVPANYILWGTLDAQYGVDLYLDGFCPTQ